MFYAGIGSRETPDDALAEMQIIGARLGAAGWWLRSGRAQGADTAFEIGCDYASGGKEIFRPEHSTPGAFEHARLFHPAWDRCGSYIKALHARNSMIMLGQRLDQPVRFVVCWTRGGKPLGGTGQALRIVAAHRIKVFNLAVTNSATLWAMLDQGMM